MQIQDIDFLTRHPRLKTARMRQDWLYSSRCYPLYWHHIAKNGGTFFKHLLYVLDHGQPLAFDSRTHNWDNQLVRAKGTPSDQIRHSDHAFIIMRNPIHRFLSVYFDKVYTGGGPLNPGMSREFFELFDLHQDPNLGPEGHTENCLKLAQWGAANIAGSTMSKPNWHLVPQMHQLLQVHDLRFRVLTKEDLPWQLIHVLQDLVPDIRTRIRMVGKRNVSDKPIAKSDILTPELKHQLKEIYAEDFQVFHQVRRFWRDAKQNT